jgi:hypothetical protein
MKKLLMVIATLLLVAHIETFALATEQTQEQEPKQEQAPAQDSKKNVDEFLEGLSDDAEETIDSGEEHEAERSAATFPCNIFSSAYLHRLMTMEMDGGTYSLVSRTEDTHAWKSDACVWQAKGEVAGMAELWISQAKHFDAGSVECYPPPEGGETLEGVGTKAWWRFQRSWSIGTLRVCAVHGLLEVQVTRPGADDATVRTIARTIAQRAIDAAARSAQP